MDRTAQHWIGITNPEPCSGFEKASNTLVQGKRAAKTRRRINLVTLSFPGVQTGKRHAEGNPEGNPWKGMGIRGGLRTLLWGA